MTFIYILFMTLAVAAVMLQDKNHRKEINAMQNKINKYERMLFSKIDNENAAA